MDHILWKALSSGLKSQYDGHQWKIGQWYKTDCKELCHGFNCSVRVIDALQYVKLENLAVVEVRGKNFLSNDKQTWEEMRIIKAWIWKKEDSVSLAIFAAELVIDIYEKKYPTDDRPRKAIEAAKKYLASSPAAAYAAAYAVAYAAYAVHAAHAAHAAAYAAHAADAADAADAAYAAAYAAHTAAHTAHAAAYAAYAVHAAHAANGANGVLEQCEIWIQERIKTLEEIKP